MREASQALTERLAETLFHRLLADLGPALEIGALNRRHFDELAREVLESIALGCDGSDPPRP